MPCRAGQADGASIIAVAYITIAIAIATNRSLIASITIAHINNIINIIVVIINVIIIINIIVVIIDVIINIIVVVIVIAVVVVFVFVVIVVTIVLLIVIVAILVRCSSRLPFSSRKRGGEERHAPRRRAAGLADG